MYMYIYIYTDIHKTFITFFQRHLLWCQDWQLVFLGGVDAMGLQPLLQISPGVRSAMRICCELSPWS